MPFVNEYISPEDAEKYALAEIDAQLRAGGISQQWTIDRERDIYLRIVSRGHEEEDRHESLWSFYWKGTPLLLRLDLLDAGGKRGGAAWSHWGLIFINGSRGLPLQLKDSRQTILEDLRQALSAYKDAGVLSKSTEFSVTLDIAEDCVL